MVEVIKFPRGSNVVSNREGELDWLESRRRPLCPVLEFYDESEVVDSDGIRDPHWWRKSMVSIGCF